MGDWIDHTAQEEVDPTVEPRNLDLLHGANQSILQINPADLQERQQPSPPKNQHGKDLMSRFFTKLDEDESGLLDVEEILNGVEKFAEAMDLDFDSRKIASLFEEFDEDGNQELDRDEFTVFLQKYAEYQGIGMEDLAYTMATMSEDQDTSTVVSSKAVPKKRNPSLFFRTMFSAVVFQGQHQSNEASRSPTLAQEDETDNTGKQRKKSDNRMSGFFRRISFAPQRDDDESESPTPSKPVKDVPDDDIHNMMWDVDTPEDTVDVFSAEGLKDFYGTSSAY